MKSESAVSLKVVALEAALGIEPINNWVLIRKYTAEEKVTEEGVIIPAGQGRSQRGVVLAAPEPNGPYADKYVRLFPGDVVIYTNFAMELEDLEDVTGEKHLQLVRYEEVYARVKSGAVQAT